MSDEVKEPIEEKKEEAPPPVVVSDPEALKKLLDDERAKSAEYLDSWRRAAADLSNYRKQTERQISELTKTANSFLILRLLPILDDLDRAEVTIPDNLRELTWIDGVMIIARKMRAILEAEGVTPIDALNKPFDPNWHEAVIHEETDKFEDGVVMVELQKGYKVGERVLRPTLVKVAKRKG